MKAASKDFPQIIQNILETLGEIILNSAKEYIDDSEYEDIIEKAKDELLKETSGLKFKGLTIEELFPKPVLTLKLIVLLSSLACIFLYSSTLSSSSFSRVFTCTSKKNRTIFKAIINLYKNGDPIDLTTVKAELDKKKSLNGRALLAI